MKLAFRAISIIVVLCSGIFCHSKSSAQVHTLNISLGSITDSVIALPDEFIIPASLNLVLDSSIVLVPGRDFTTDSLLQKLSLSAAFRKTFFGIPSGEHRVAPIRSLQVRYAVLPFTLHRHYSRYEIPDQSDTTISHKGRPDYVFHQATGDNSTGNDKSLTLTKSGGITRGIQAGSTQDLSFTNSFNLTFSGSLGDELSCKGALSEESTPLQPEGNTQILRDVDRIYIEMTAGKIFQATLGDYTLDLHPIHQTPLFHDNELDPIFNNFSRKVLGAKTVLDIGPTEVILSASATKGQFTTNVIQGIDAVQGPYRLQGKNGERDIIVIAGTEHVYIDGVLMARGELNDYVIDYGLSEIRFTSKRIVSSSSRITVDFEYTDQQYSRTLIAASQSTQFLDNKLRISTSYIREGDNQNAPLNLNLSDSDKALLTSAGADPLKTGKSGVSIAGKDSLGRAKGNYARIDTVMGTAKVTFYRYAPYDTVGAVYNVAFGHVGTNKGSYVRNGLGQYSFIGVGVGDYDTTNYLPLPQRNQIFTGQVTFAPTNTLALSAEFALSDLEQNLFAPIPSLQDHAYHLYGVYRDTIGTLSVGVNYSERYTGGNYTPIDRDRTPEELRAYGLDLPSQNYAFSQSSERERKASIFLAVPAVASQVSFGSYDRADGIFSSERFAAEASLIEDSSWRPRISLSASHVPTKDSSIASTSVWDSYSAAASKSIPFLQSVATPALEFHSESKRSYSFFDQDTLAPNAYRFNLLTPKIDLALNNKIKFGASIGFRSDDSARAGTFTRISNATTFQFTSSLMNLSGFSTQMDLGYLKRNYVDSLSKATDGGDVSSLLIRLQPRYQSSGNVISVSGLYEASEQRSARLERVFFPVQKGLGNYKYLGDLNGNGKQDPEEFALATYADEGAFILLSIPTEALYPVTDLHSSLRIRLAPVAFLSTETSVRIEENSSDPRSSDIYLLKFSHFLGDSLTLHGLIETQQDISILDNNPTQSYRLRFLERKNTTQYNTGLEQLYYREFSLRGKFRPTYEMSNETTIAEIRDNAITDDHSTTPSHHTQRIDLTTQWTFEPFASAFGFGLKAAFSYAQDNSLISPVTAELSSISANARYSLTPNARLRTEIGIDDLALKNASATIALPYALTQGRTPSNTWLWSLSLDIQIASGIVLTAGYNGRSELADGINRTVIHNGRAEVRASF